MDFIGQALYPVAPNHCRASKANCVFKEATLWMEGKEILGRLTQHSWWVSLPLLKVLEFIPILANVASEWKVIGGNSFCGSWRRKKEDTFSKQMALHGVTHVPRIKDWVLSLDIGHPCPLLNSKIQRMCWDDHFILWMLQPHRSQWAPGTGKWECPANSKRQESSSKKQP